MKSKHLTTIVPLLVSLLIPTTAISAPAVKAVEVNGVRVPSTLVDSRNLRATIPAEFTRSEGVLIVVVINPEGMSIRIEHIRAMQRQLGYKPYESQRTIIIIDGCESLTPPAANALLKTLEEPPASALLLLLTSKKDALPLTIISRCQQISFRPLAPPHIRAILTQQGVDEPTAALVATLAEGRVDTWMQTEISQVLARRQSAYTLLQERGHTKSMPLFLLARQWAGSR